MDFLDPQKKRAHRIRLYIGYGLMTIALATATYLLVNAAYGYGIDRSSGSLTIIQNGLIIVNAHPESAQIKVNGADKGTTDTRLVLPEGPYNIELSRDGYRDWKRSFTLSGSKIEQLIYPFLFPEKLVTKNLETYTAAPSFAIESPDRHWLVVSLPEQPGSFQVVDLNNKQHPVTSLTLPSTVATASTSHTYEAVEWSTDNNHLLLKHTFAEGAEFISLNRSDAAQSTNLNKVFPTVAFDTVSLRDKRSDQFYLLNTSTGTLLSADSRTGSTSPVATSVANYKSFGNDTILYTTLPASGAKEIDVHIKRGTVDHALRTLPVAATYMLEMAEFSGHFYLAVGSPADGKTYLYKDPFNDYNSVPARTPQPFRVLVQPGSQYVSLSANARFIAVQAGSSFTIYDIETVRQYRYDTKLKVADNQKTTWMDGHRLLLNSEGTIYVFDYDGINKQALSAEAPTFIPYFDRDYTALFSLAPADAGKVNLTRTELKVNP